ncbi:GrpB family protein [Abyssisolibacter fermentans]|uniref:GrpB family protein n=1 Tax=Abyssisolibacter fermentans TaxID=1766203 RepID=UPI0008307FB6|nr:GrpB family protein [Abyssisolibacter fermentans]
MTRKIVVEDYNPKWAEEFEKLKAVYLEKLKEINVDIQHVGSTSVCGLAAKPIIDIDIIVQNDEDLKNVIKRLASLGYEHEGNMGIKGREAFKRVSDEVPYNTVIKEWMPHHLYAGIRGCVSLENHLLLRDYLRQNKDAALEYGNLKKKLAVKYKYDIDTYVEKKTSFIIDILSKSGISKKDLLDIEKQNKK